jgi:DNA repair exonuclease SbcCD ATPase subunit
MILFEKLRWKNLLSTGNIFTEIQLDKFATTLIVGENGAGKSTILDALSFVLFGKPFRKINKPQLLNSITQKHMVVEVEFSIGSNKYKIIRGMKPNVFEVYQNGVLLNQSAETKDYQEVLEKQILKVNFKSFSQVVVLGSATFQPFMQLPAGQRREIIEDLLDLQIFTTMNYLLKDKVQVNNEQIVATTSNKKLIEEKIKFMREHLVELQNNNDQLIEDKKQRIEQTNIQIAELDKEFWGVKQKIEDLKEQTIDEPSLKKKLDKLTKLKHQIEAKLGLLQKEVDFFHKYDNCPTCQQQIDEKFKCETVDNKTAEINHINNGLKQLSDQYSELNFKIQQIMKINSDITENMLEFNRIKNKIASLIEYREELEVDINSIKKTAPKEDDTKITDLEAELEYNNSKYNRMIEERNLLSAAGILLKDGGIKSKIIKQYVPVINKLINKYLSAMDFFVQFELDENFSETIKSRYRDDFSYASFSEGEKMRINLAILFTWRAVAKLRNSINTNLLIMDEVFDSSLDSNGTEEFLKIIQNLTTDTNTVIISHKTDQLYDKFEKIVKFEKHKNFSRMAA